MYKGIILFCALITSCSSEPIQYSYTAIDPYTGLYRTYLFNNTSYLTEETYRNPNELRMEYECSNLYRMGIY